MWFYVVYSCFAGFAMAGINSGFLNLVYDYVRLEDRAVAIGFKAAVSGIAGFLSAIFAGWLLERIQLRGGITVLGVTLYAQQVLSAVSFGIIVLLLIYMIKIIIPMRKTKEQM